MPFTPTDYLPYDFANRRHIGPSPEEMAAMLDTLGLDSLDALIDATIPASLRASEPLDWGKARSEREMIHEMRVTAAKNKVFQSLLGQGYHGTVTPPVIQRNILENPAWYTAYTPYQPEISQGRLEALLNFQTMIADLTGLEIANASLRDEASACAEAMVMAQRVAKTKATEFFIDENCHPQNIAVMKTRAAPLGIEVIIGDPAVEAIEADKVFGAIFQYPGTHGDLRDFSPQMEKLHAHKAIGIVAADPMALCLLKEPGAMGADIAVGSAQRFGIPMGNGGPHPAYMATRDAYKRAMPGRLVGVSVDSHGNKAYRLSLQTREQHIRREKATSNVCTAQALLAVMAGFYAVFHGPEGLKAIAQRIHRKTLRLARGLEEAGFEVRPATFFDTITVEVGLLQKGVLQAARREGIKLRPVGKTQVGITLDESIRPATIEGVWRAFGIDRKDEEFSEAYRLPASLLRESPYLTHPVFHMNRAETEMMRYMRRLADRDLALDRAMIPLGSCTMKLNSAAEMMPVSWREFSMIHPCAPEGQKQGYRLLIDDLRAKLCQITGYDDMSMQPNSGAQGEYAGLLTIQAWHRSRGEVRDICLIPMSAHGTNPASAHMAGMKVVVVKTAENGDIDLEDFRQKAEEAGARLAAA
ncbi:MAG TPA: glycine dehydrogenase (aminomethyl-transferring), partial [Aliiroseovarius sp.]|nr:glycine dehydrogenase (aminomethyl-transferring) [Aliiroseovarius sp.]